MAEATPRPCAKCGQIWNHAPNGCVSALRVALELQGQSYRALLEAAEAVDEWAEYAVRAGFISPERIEEIIRTNVTEANWRSAILARLRAAIEREGGQR